MKNNHAQTPRTAPRFRLVVCLAALAVAFTVWRPQSADAHDDVEPPDVPSILEVPSGHKVFLKGHAIGTQNYICLPSDLGRSWTFFGPQATLFNDEDKQIITHFLSSNPDPEDSGTLRPTWQHSRDTSTVWARQVPGASSTDPDFVADGAIPWLLLEIVGAEPGPTGGNRLTRTTFIQRLNTSDGIAPTGECPEVGQKAFMPYRADYFFYKATKHE
jgi:hypothetical protein